MEPREDLQQEEIQLKEERLQKIREFLQNSQYAELQRFVLEMEPEDIAEMLGEFSIEDKLKVFNLLDLDNAAVVLDDTDPQTRLQLLQQVDNEQLAKILDTMPIDEAADVIEEIPEEEREDLLEKMKKEEAEEVEEILSYPEDSAARVMNPEFIYARENNDVEDAIRHIRSLEVDAQVFYVYVVDEGMRLRGIVPIRKLLTAPKGTLIKDIMDEEVHSISAETDQEQAANIMKKYNSIEYAKEFARNLVSESWKAVNKLLSPSDAKENLRAFANYLIERSI